MIRVLIFFKRLWVLVTDPGVRDGHGTLSHRDPVKMYPGLCLVHRS